MHFFEFIKNNQINNKPDDDGVDNREKKKVISNNLRIILLAIRLQHLTKKGLNNEAKSFERITKHSLIEGYLDAQVSANFKAAKKTAERDLCYIQNTFGLAGSSLAGYIMEMHFESFLLMFQFWLSILGEPSSSNRRMHVLLSGLIEAIENGFRDDPVIISDLARELKLRFGNKNLRDSKEPLLELFSNYTITSHLRLIEEDENEVWKIDKSSDPLLMRLKDRDEVGSNEDISINLVLPGRVRAVFNDHIQHLDEVTIVKVRYIAKAVRESHAWQDESGVMMIPYILYREGSNGPLILTLWQQSDGHYRDIAIAEIASVPIPCAARFIPYQMPDRLWKSFSLITA